MAIDESGLAEKIRSLEVLEINTRELLDKITSTKSVLESISEAGAIDPITQQPTSDKRRQEVYDACIPVAAELLGLEAAE